MPKRRHSYAQPENDTGGTSFPANYNESSPTAAAGLHSSQQVYVRTRYCMHAPREGRSSRERVQVQIGSNRVQVLMLVVTLATAPPSSKGL